MARYGYICRYDIYVFGFFVFCFNCILKSILCFDFFKNIFV
jgi:hypothetical protein